MTNYEKYKLLEELAYKMVLEPNNKLIEKPMQVYKGFISKDTIIKPYSNNNIGFNLDDIEIYKLLDTYNVGEERNLSSDINCIQKILDEYFVYGTDGVESVKNENQNIHSISKYKGRGGQCIQKSSIANNLLNILGYDCEMVWTNTETENHAFIILHADGKSYIYDPSNHSRVYTNDSYFKIPTIIEKSEKEINDFYSNKRDLFISSYDEEKKNAKQNNPNMTVVIPKIRYYCRKSTDNISLSKRNVIDEYISSLKNRGLSDDEIKKVLNKIKEDVQNNIKPKVHSLDEVYEAFESKSIPKM